jgi:hypothetical protein
MPPPSPLRGDTSPALRGRMKTCASRNPEQFFVIAGLDPAIHQTRILAKKMDARIKSGHDDGER